MRTARTRYDREMRYYHLMNRGARILPFGDVDGVAEMNGTEYSVVILGKRIAR